MSLSQCPNVQGEHRGTFIIRLGDLQVFSKLIHHLFAIRTQILHGLIVGVRLVL